MTATHPSDRSDVGHGEWLDEAGLDMGFPVRSKAGSKGLLSRRVLSSVGRVSFQEFCSALETGVIGSHNVSRVSMSRKPACRVKMARSPAPISLSGMVVKPCWRNQGPFQGGAQNV